MSILIFWLAQLLCSSASAEDLDTYLELALRVNPEIQAKMLEIQLADARARQAGFLPDPRLMSGVAISPVQTRLGPQQGKISVSQQIPWFGSLQLQKDVLYREINLKNQEFNEVVFRIWYQVIEQWLIMIEQNQRMNILNKNSEILDSYHEIMLHKYAQGQDTMADVLRVEMQIERNNLKKQLVSDKLEFQKKKFFLLLGADSSQDFTFPEHFLDKELSSNMDSINPRLQWYEEKLLMLEVKEKLVKKQNNPSFQFGVDYIFIGEMTDHEMADNGKDAIIPMVGLSIPVYQKKKKARRDEIYLEKQVVSLKKNAFVLGNQASIEEILFLKEKNQARIASIEKELQLNQKTLVLLEQAYQVSGKGFEDILKKQEDLLQLQMKKIAYEKEYFLAEAKYNQLLGVHYVDF